MATNAKNTMENLDSSETGANSVFFDSLSYFFTALDNLTAYFDDYEDECSCFSKVFPGRLSSVGDDEWLNKFAQLQMQKIHLQHTREEEERIAVYPFLVWHVVKHCGIRSIKTTSSDIIAVGEILLNKTEIIDYMNKGIQLIETASV